MECRLNTLSFLLLTLVSASAAAGVNSHALADVASGKIKVAKASWWGFDPVDSTEALQAAINSKVPRLVVDNVGAPWVSRGLTLVSNQKIEFEKGVELLAKRGEFKGKTDALLTGVRLTNLTLRGYGATLRMWRSDYDQAPYIHSEWRHLIRLFSCRKVRILGLTLTESGGDGIYLGHAPEGPPNRDVLIKDCACTKNYRQGISVVTAENLLIEHTVLRNTAGTNPQSGIDFEPNHPGDRLVNCVMRNCVAENNAAHGFAVYLWNLNPTSAPVSIKFENCRASGNVTWGAAVNGHNNVKQAARGVIEFHHCALEGNKQASFCLGDNPATGAQVLLDKCSLGDAAPSAPVPDPILFLARKGSTQDIGGVKFVDCLVHCPPGRNPMRFTDATGKLKLADVTGNLILEDKDQRTPVLLNSLVTGGHLVGTARAEVCLPRVFGSQMVLQQEKPLTIWGWAKANETVTVQLSSAKCQAQANERGEWKAVLPAMKAGGPYTLTVSGSSTVRCEDVMVGEVWLCSGQSNMEMGIGLCRDARQEIAAADYPGIRLLKVPKRWAPQPQNDIEGLSWKSCSPKTVAEGGWGGFSAVAYYFGRELHRKLGVAVGLIDASWGGTRIEPWTPLEGFATVPALKREYELVQLADPRTELHRQRLEQTLRQTEQWVAAARQALAQRALVPSMPTYPADLLPPRDYPSSTAVYNGMIHPLCPFALRGTIWYQGESNHPEGKLYTERMKALISGWRKLWGEGDFPFYFVQIAPCNYGGNPELVPAFWEAQSAAQAIPNTGMVVVNDIGNLKNVHPANKQEVGRRLALWALARTYGQEKLVYSGPVFKAMSIEGDKLRLTFEHAGGGLASRDGKPLNWFEIIDANDGGFVKADARIDGSTIVLSAPEVKDPVAMRFAWSMLAEPNLMNAEGLPASAFRAGSALQPASPARHSSENSKMK